MAQLLSAEAARSVAPAALPGAVFRALRATQVLLRPERRVTVTYRATLEPLFASYGMPPNSDYAPVLDLNAARQRFMEKSAAEVVALLNAELPLLELLEPERSRRAINPLFKGAYAFERADQVLRRILPAGIVNLRLRETYAVDALVV
jgi:hypothetical protein